MGRYTPSNLLILASFFERRALKSLAQTTPNFPGASFAYGINRLSNSVPTKEQWRSWLEANRTVLGDLPWKNWEDYSDKMQCELDWKSGVGSTWAYVTKTSASPDPQFEAEKVAILRASSPIPPLWLQIGRFLYRSNPLPAEIAHEGWLYETLDRLFGTNLVDFKKFIARNKTAIDRVRRSFTSSNPKYLGSGADGVVFDLGNRVLKIFRDQTSYEAAKLAFDRLHQISPLAKTEAMIYDVGELGLFDDGLKGKPVYYYIIEKMTPIFSISGEDPDLPGKIREILLFVIDKMSLEKASKWRPLKEMINDPSKAQEVRKIVKETSSRWAAKFIDEDRSVVDYIERAIKGSGAIGNRGLKKDWLELYIEEVIMKYLTGRTDLHMGNIGVTSYGELRYYDPAYAGLQSDINTVK
jgi:hypothetical protein